MEDGTAGQDRPDLDALVNRALADAGVHGGEPGTADIGRPVDRHWLSVGLRLGLEQPELARLVLGLLGSAGAGGGGTPVADRGAPAANDPAADDGGAPSERDPRADVSDRSRLLARSAAMAATPGASLDPEAMFGWASRLTRDEVTLIGRVLKDQLAGGASRDLGRGFGVAWTGGVSVPTADYSPLFKAFTELEVTVCGVLAGYDLRATPRRPEQGGVAGLLGSLFTRSDPRAEESAAVLERAGEPARLGLVALWNTWAAMRYRSAIPAALFEQLVHPWVTVVGPLPDA